MSNTGPNTTGDPDHERNRSPASLVIYDGDCGVCQAFANWLMRLDNAEKLSLIAYQNANLHQLDPGLDRESVQRALHFVGPSGRRHRGARAVFNSLQTLPGIWGWMGTLLANPIMSTLIEPFYRLFARHRTEISKLLGLQVCEPAPSILREPHHALDDHPSPRRNYHSARES